MIRLIRHKKTRQYLKEGGGWVGQADEAWRFEDVNSVLDAVHTYELVDVEMILLISDTPSRLDVVIDL